MRVRLIIFVGLAVLVAAAVWLVLDPGGEPGLGEPAREEAATAGGALPSEPDPSAAPTKPAGPSPQRPTPALPPDTLTDIPTPTTGAISGRVRFVGASPGPAAGAKVLVLNEASGKWREARTGAEGAFRIADLAPALWKIRVMPRGYPRLMDDAVRVTVGEDTVRDFEVPRGTLLSGRVIDSTTGLGIPGAKVVFLRHVFHTVPTNADGAYRAPGVTRVMMASVKITADGYNGAFERPVLDDPAPAAATLDFKLRPLARVTGKVVDPTGAPVAGAEVRRHYHLLFRSDRPGPTTDAEGRFDMRVPTVEGRRHHQTVRLFSHAKGFAYGLTRSATFIDGERVHGVVIRLRPGGTVAGRVIGLKPDDKATAHLWPDGPPAPGRGGDKRETTVGPDGVFRVEDLAAGRYHAQVRCPRASSPTTRVTVQAGGVAQVELSLEDHYGLIHGQVVDDRDQPVRDASITAIRQPDRLPIDYNAPRAGWLRARTDAAGRFRITHLEKGRYDLSVAKPGHRWQDKKGVRPGPAAVRVVLPRAHLVAIGGKVVDQGGAPVRDFRIAMVEDRGGKLEVVRGRNTPPPQRKDGVFLVYLRPATKPRRVLIEAITTDGRCSPRTALQVLPEKLVPPVKLVVAEGAAIHGKVLSPSGEAVASAQVELNGGDSGSAEARITTVTGGFAFRALTPGPYRVRARHPWWEQCEQTVTVGKGETAKLVLHFEEPTGHLSILVQNPKGRPVAGAQVYRTWPAPRQERARFEAEKRRDPKLTWDAYRNRLIRTDRTGRWERRNLPGGKWSVYIKAEGFEDREVKVTLLKGEKRTLRVVLQPKNP